MLKVERLSPSEVPGRCMFYPSVIADDEGFYIGMDLDGLTPGSMRACISVRGLKEMARKEGMIDAQEAEEEIASLHARVEELERELAEADEFQDHFDGLVKAGLVVRKQPGRKPKPKEKVDA